MKISVLAQYAGNNPLIEELERVLGNQSNCEFRAIVAYISVNGLKELESSLRKFLGEKSNSVNWIVGVDQGITTRDALLYLRGIKKDFGTRFEVKVFSAGNDNFVFHPKLYWVKGERFHRLVAGSSNLTAGGLLGNFEISIRLQLDAKLKEDQRAIDEVEEIWRAFSTPDPPMDRGNLLGLSSAIALVPKATKEERKARSTLHKRRHPFNKADKGSAIRKRLRRKRQVHGKRGKVTGRKTWRQLIMDVLTETRGTQVQLPTEVLGTFFGATSRGRGTIKLSEVAHGNIVKSDWRPFVNPRSNKTHRIEITGIRGLDRPLIVVFERRAVGNFLYKVVPNSSMRYETLNELLGKRGRQTLPQSRRYLLLDRKSILG